MSDETKGTDTVRNLKISLKSKTLTMGPDEALENTVRTETAGPHTVL